MRFSVTLLASTALSSVALAALPADHLVDTMMDTPDAMPGDGLCADAMGACSLRAAVQESNALGGLQIVQLSPGATYPLALAGAGEDGAATGDLDVTAMIRLQGDGAAIDAGGLDRAFDVMAGASLWLQDLEISNGYVVDTSGGAVRSLGDLRLLDVTVRDSAAMGVGASGGALFNDRGFLHAVRTTLVGNAAERAGGGVEANEGTTIVAWSSLLDNDTGAVPGNGGGLHLTGRGTVLVSHTLVTGNTASREGGGLWNSSTGTMAIEACTIDGNAAFGSAADDGGGGVFNDGGFMTIGGSTIRNNTATTGSGSGGGVFNNQGDLTMWVTTVEGNTANRAGGGVEANLGATSLIQSTLRANTTGPSPGNGGGLHLTGAGDVYLDEVRAIGNVASAEGGGVWNSATGTMTIVGSLIGRNVAHGAAADQGGGGLFNDGGVMIVEDTRVLENVADGASGSGGGVLNNLGVLTFTGGEIARNTSIRAGGGVEANVGATTLDGVSLTANRTGATPGNGGGLHLTGAGLVEVYRSSVVGNDASAEGGGLWNSATGEMIVAMTTFRRNTAPVNPTAHNDGGTFTINGNDVPVTP